MAAVVSQNHPLTIVFMAAAGAFLSVAALGFVADVISVNRRGKDRQAIVDFIANDASPSVFATEDGVVTAQNLAAAALCKVNPAESVTAFLSSQFANPSAIVFRLQDRAEKTGAAREDIVTRSGHVRLSLHRVTDGFLWRVETIQEKGPARSRDFEQSLPMMMVGRSGAVLFMNEASRGLIGSRVKTLDRVFKALPVTHGDLAEVMTVEGEETMLVGELEAGAGRKALYLLPAYAPRSQDAEWRGFQELPIPLIKIAPNGAVMSYNQMAENLVGPQLQPGAPLASLMEGLGRSINDWLTETLDGKLMQKSEFLRLKRDDREAFVQVTLSLVTDQGEPALIAVLNDATQLKTLEAQFVQSQKMQAIGQLAGGVAHDFNNLLTAISGHCDLLLLRHDQGDSDYSDLIQINQNTNRAAALVGQLLAFSRKQTLQPETLDLRDTLADLTHLLNRLVGEKVTLTLRHDPVLKPIRADKRQLEQVLMNLVVNARDAMQDGGEIKITTECLDLQEPLSRDRVSVPPGQYVTLQVADEGTGIAEDKLQKVFEPFYTTKRTGEGTGLGLSTAYGIIKQSGGFIFADSTVGVGTVFTLYFPVLTRAMTQKPDKAAAPAAAATNFDDGIILLVEDEAPVRAFASRALRMRGYTVLEAESAEMALKTLEDETLNVDVFVTDVIMPGMDGPSWVREALKDRPGVPVVFVSGYAEDSFGAEQTAIPNSVFLPKPFSLTDLTNTVHSQMR
ncbi:ATP-binding protein [Sulfitobacter marinus]|uniref:hybrid sensor histidine kinase/response regulator n=1 Tax=Sulfitobacter marinus TaxID=394264 RepID=UPI003CCC4293